jgi:tRNA modification GTPase
MEFKDDIVAISSPPGVGAISLIRVSGPNAIKKTDSFLNLKKKKNLEKEKSHTLHFGEFIFKDEIIDEVVVSIFKNNKSFTGEETVELTCHGSVYIQKTIVESLLTNKIRLAKPGEFTLRAFLNGRMDLTQAEAVSDLIYSDSKAMHKISLNQMRGGFQNELKLLRADLLHFLSMIELELDFSEEDVSFANKSELTNLVNKVELKLVSLKETFKVGNAIKHGVPVTIVGKPNAGKSSLLNSLLNEEKAIVSNIPGTTRDAIEDTTYIDGIKYRFIDTAGLRETKNEIESKGIEIAKSKVSKASVLIYMFDILDTTVEEILKDLNELYSDDLNVILVRNKIDLKKKFDVDTKLFSKFKIESIFEIIATQQSTLLKLKENLSNNYKQVSSSNHVVVTNLRHYNFLIEALESIEKVKEAIENEIPGDLLSIDLKNVVHFIGEITGEISNDEMLGNIFSNFCIGK